MAGLLILLGYALLGLATDSSTSILLKASLVTVLMGLVILFVSVVMQQRRGHSKDSYKDIELGARLP